MRTKDESTREICVSGDPAHASIELSITTPSREGDRIVSLGREEARRLAALILFHAARLDRDHAEWPVHTCEPVRRSA